MLSRCFCRLSTGSRVKVKCVVVHESISLSVFWKSSQIRPVSKSLAQISNAGRCRRGRRPRLYDGSSS